MTEPMHGGSAARRVLSEHRRTIVPLAAAVAVNVLVYLFVVYPLQERVTNIEERNRAADSELAAARQEHAQASGTLTGKDRAAQELATFYNTILPQGLTGARRLTLLRLAQLARQSNMSSERVGREVIEGRESPLTRLKTTMQLSGSYSNMRTFIYQLETSPEFVVIDHIELTEGDDGGALAVAMELSTYYRTEGAAPPLARP